MSISHRAPICLACALALLALVVCPLSPTSAAARLTAAGGSRASAMRRPTSAGVRAVPVTPVMGPGARLTRLAATANDLYVIDAGPWHVRRYILNGLPYAELFTQVMRWKEGDNGLILGQPLDFFPQGERLLILDSVGNLWSYSGSTFGRALVPLRLQSNQGTPAALAVHNSDLLLLDPARQRIWRYAPDAAGGYDTTPRSLLAHALPALADAVRLAVSRDALLVLRRDGRVLALPWARPDRGSIVRLPFGATALWAVASASTLLVASRDALALVTPDGAVQWHIALQGLGGEVIADVARSPLGALYVITRSRLWRVPVTPPQFGRNPVT